MGCLGLVGASIRCFKWGGVSLALGTALWELMLRLARGFYSMSATTQGLGSRSTGSFFRKLIVGSIQAGAIALLLGVAGEARAQVSNEAEISIGSTGEQWAVGSYLAMADSFTTGSSATNLSSVSLVIFGSSGTGFSLSLYSDAAGAPGTSVESLSGNASPTSGTYSYTSGGSTVLAANTTYWVVAAGPTSGPDYYFNFDTTSSTAQTGAAGWSIGDTKAYMSNPSFTWTSGGGPSNSPSTSPPSPSRRLTRLWRVLVR